MAQEQEWQTLSGTVENIVYCNEENGYTVLEFSSGGDLYTAVGELSDVNVGEDVTLHGRFVTHPSFGEQFRVEACEVRMPESAKSWSRLHRPARSIRLEPYPAIRLRWPQA